MSSNPLTKTSSIFRTEAWVQAWIDTWGNHPNIELIDLGGRKNPLEYVYREKTRLKKILPVSRLHLAGVGCSNVSTPRSEYNDVDGLISMYGDVEATSKSLAKIKWQEFVLQDIVDNSLAADRIGQLSRRLGTKIYVKKTEPAYQVCSDNFENYLASLGGSTRLKYFNRRDRLASFGIIERKRFAIKECNEFFKLLNEFHIQRWGSPCYSQDSQNFMRNFQERIIQLGGQSIMEALSVNDEIVSVIFDMVWAEKRYNFQSGYAENRFQKIALGAVHMGYSIEDAVKNKQIYDFMAGRGKNNNYKAHIANSVTPIKTVLLQRSYMKTAAWFYDALRRK